MAGDPGRLITRRRFLGKLSLLSAAVAAGCADLPFPGWLGTRPRRSSRKLRRDQERSWLAVVGGRDLGRMLRAGLDAVPGLEDALKDARRVVLKPNATASQPYPVTTDVRLLWELIDVIKRRSSARVLVCDSPSYAGLAARRVFSRLGYFDLQDARVEVRCIDPTVGSHFVKVTAPGWRENEVLLSHNLIQDADLVINLAIPKRHHAADFTCALKNSMGCIYETFRSLAHIALARTESGPAVFDRSIAEFADALRPELTIVDARSLLTVTGPGFVSGESQIVERVNQLVFASDPVAADSYCADLLQTHDATFTRARRVDRQLECAEALGTGSWDLSQVEVVTLVA